MTTQEFLDQNLWWIVPLALWELVWKGIALWKAARADARNWFIALLLINSAGVLPILYIYVFSKTKS